MKKALIFVFLALVCSPYLGSVLGISSQWDNTERRTLAQFPKFTFENRPNWSTMLTVYFNDNFGFRNIMIQAYQQAKINFLQSKFLDRAIYHNGWVFEAGGTKGYLKEYYSHGLLTDEELTILKKTLNYENELLSQRGIPYIVFVAPKKQTVYPEFFPYPEDKIFGLKFNQVRAFLNKNFSSNFIDLSASLERAKKEYPLYYRSDTHWNNYAAFISYQEIAKVFSRHSPQFEPLLKEDFEVNLEQYFIWNGDDAPKFPNSPTHPDYGVKLSVKNGVLSKKSKLSSVLVFGDSYIHTKKGIPKEVFENLFPELKDQQNLFFKDAPLRDTPNQILLPVVNIEELIPFIEKNVPDKKTRDRFIKFVINSNLKDDEMEGLAQFLLFSFNKVILEDKNKSLMEEEIDKYKPDLVIRETDQTTIEMLYKRDDGYQKQTMILSIGE